MLPIVLAALLLTSCPLRVTLHDGAGAPLTATVQVRDAAGATLAEAQTAGGVAELCGLPEAGAVRVAVAGQLAQGVPLALPPAEAKGIRVQLAGGPVQLDLRVEDDGTVIPDPATMIVPEPVARSAPRAATGAAEEPTSGALVVAVPSPALLTNTPATLADTPAPATAAAAPASTPLWVWLVRLGLFGLVLLLWWYPMRRRR